jgi:alpha-amylase
LRGRSRYVNDAGRLRRKSFHARCGSVLLAATLGAGLLVGCSDGADSNSDDSGTSDVYYEIFVRSFYDSNGDGVGDLRGIIEKLDYLNDGDPKTDEDLGVGGLWLMPIQPSPSYHGYDVTDYYGVNPDYGTMEDFKALTAEAAERGMKVIIDLVVNHTSVEHPWFEDSASAKDSEHRDWYLWAEDTGQDTGGSSAASGGRAWHPRGGSHYLAGFWEGMPDLNFDNPEVRAEMVKIGRYWLDAGADGFRLDAAKHIYEDLQTASAADKKALQEKNVAWWQEFRDGLTSEGEEAPYLVGEIWDNSPVVIAPYLDDALDSGFNFSLAEQLLSAAKSGTSSSAASMLGRIHALYKKSSGGAFIDAPFLANHDQPRVMSQLEGDVDKAKMAASLLLTMPGRPFLYYGEEIGMAGKKPDERIREPFAWYADETGGQGQTSWERSMYSKGGEASVEAQVDDPESMLSHYRKLVSLRGEEPLLRDGTIDSYAVEDSRVMAYTRTGEAGEGNGSEAGRLLVLHNLSSEAASVTLDKDDRWENVIFSTRESIAIKDGNLTLPAYTTVVVK